MTLIRDIQKLKRVLEEKWYEHRYINRDIAAQKRDLTGYESGIQQVVELNESISTTYAAFVYFEPALTVAPNVQRILKSLRQHGVNTIVLCNHELQPDQEAFFAEHAYSLVLRDNQGYDFGAYQDAVKLISDAEIDIDRLLFLNDSVYYASVGLDQFVAGLLGPEDIVAGYENWGEDHHVQSFALSASSHVLESPEFTKFWADYAPINNRVHAIESGEKGLSRAALTAARTSKILFNIADLAHALIESPGSLPDLPTVYCQPWRASIESVDVNELTWDARIAMVMSLVNATSPAHAGAYLFPKYLKSPVFKKDLVYRGRFQFWEIENWIAELLPPDEATEFLGILRKKGDPSKLDKSDLHRYFVGAK